MDYSDGSKGIAKFDGSDFTNWSFKMKMLLVTKGLRDLIDETVKAEDAPDAGDNATVAREKRERCIQRANRDQQALATICLRVADSQLAIVRDTATAKEAWDKLVAQFEVKSLANEMFLLKRIITIRMLDMGSGMMEHINAIRTLAHQLDAVGHKLSEKFLVVILLNSLPPSYDNLVTSLESRPANELTMDIVTARLVHEEMKRGE